MINPAGEFHAGDSMVTVSKEDTASIANEAQQSTDKNKNKDVDKEGSSSKDKDKDVEKEATSSKDKKKNVEKVGASSRVTTRAHQ